MSLRGRPNDVSFNVYNSAEPSRWCEKPDQHGGLLELWLTGLFGSPTTYADRWTCRQP